MPDKEPIVLTEEQQHVYDAASSVIEDAVTANGQCEGCSTAALASHRMGMAVALERASQKSAERYAARLLTCKGVGQIGSSQSCHLQYLNIADSPPAE